jgi:TatA/E family protein of Tat protein translocase
MARHTPLPWPVLINVGQIQSRGKTGGIMFEGIMQPMHLLVILIIALLFFGPSKLAGLGKGLGDGIRQFKDALKEEAPGGEAK